MENKMKFNLLAVFFLLSFAAAPFAQAQAPLEEASVEVSIAEACEEEANEKVLLSNEDEGFTEEWDTLYMECLDFNNYYEEPTLSEDSDLDFDEDSDLEGEFSLQ